uniref:Uncharacterized protein n=1 Tax=Avena sativa TaxID=4498 RepID=A0ACD6A184_AVESA
MVVCYGRTLGQSGPVLQRPVILPPLEAGSERCSVKPASRGACHFRDRETEAFAPLSPLRKLERAAHYANWNGQASDLQDRPRPRVRTKHPHTTLNAPTWVTSSRD